MGESRYFHAGHPQGSHPGARGHRTHALYPEPVLTGAARGYAPGYAPSEQPVWNPSQPHHGAASYAPYAAGMSPDPAYAVYPAAGYEMPPHLAEDAPARARSMQTGAVMHGLGAVLSLALLVGAAGWMWQMMQRDVAGVPVVRALEGPLRVAPETPGGRQAAHQGLSINELSAAGDVVPREQIVLAPPPLDLGRDDRSGSLPSEPEFEHTAEFEDQPIPVAMQQPEASTQSGTGLGINAPTRRAVATSPRPPARGTRQPSAEATQMAALASPAPANAMPIANDLAASVASSVAAGLSGVREIDIDPATIGPGTRLVQLGAYDDIAAARAAWDTLASRFSPLLDDRGRVIEAAHSGGSVFFRLRAHGFTDERDARRFCAALVDQQIDCIPVLIR